MIFGLIQKDDLPLIQTCLTDAQTIDQEVNEVVTDFAKGDLSDIVDGV